MAAAAAARRRRRGWWGAAPGSGARRAAARAAGTGAGVRRAEAPAARRRGVERPDEWTPLLLRAAAVETDPVRLQGLLLAAQQPEQAAQALQTAGKSIITQGGVRTVLGLCGQFPVAFMETSAELQLVAGR